MQQRSMTLGSVRILRGFNSEIEPPVPGIYIYTYIHGISIYKLGRMVFLASGDLKTKK
jgi:hypothetical protein